MKKITMLTGEISSIHELNLRNWVFVAFDGVESVEINYDLTKDRTKDLGEGFVDFNLTVDPAHTVPKLLKERCETLAGWVRSMFWHEIRVKVNFNGVNQFTDSTIDLEPNPKNFKEEKSFSEAYKEVKDGPKQD